MQSHRSECGREIPRADGPQSLLLPQIKTFQSSGAGPPTCFVGSTRAIPRPMNLWTEVLYATRRLMAKPGFLVVALLTLALGVGFNAAIFTFVNAFLLRPLPVEQPTRLMTLNFGRNPSPNVSFPNYLEIRDRNQVFSALAAMRAMPMALSLTGENARIWGYLVSGNYFPMLGIEPWRGRFLTEQDD